MPAYSSQQQKGGLDINKWCCIAFSGLKTSFFSSFINLSSGIAYWNVTVGVESSVRAPWGFRVLCSDSAEEIRCFKELNKLEGRECYLQHIKIGILKGLWTYFSVAGSETCCLAWQNCSFLFCLLALLCLGEARKGVLYKQPGGKA